MLKVTLVLFVLALVSINGQETNPLSECHGYTQTFYLMFEGTTDNVRTRMTEYTEIVTQNLMDVIEEEFRSWEQVTKRCASSRSSEAVGEIVRQCAEQKYNQLIDLHNGIFDDLEAISVLSNQLAIMPVTQLGDINIVLEYENFEQLCETFVLDQYNELEYEIVPSLDVHLTALINARDTMPRDLEACIDGAMHKRFPNVHSC